MQSNTASNCFQISGDWSVTTDLVKPTCHSKLTTGSQNKICGCGNLIKVFSVKINR